MYLYFFHNIQTFQHNFNNTLNPLRVRVVIIYKGRLDLGKKWILGKFQNGVCFVSPPPPFFRDLCYVLLLIYHFSGNSWLIIVFHSKNLQRFSRIQSSLTHEAIYCWEVIFPQIWILILDFGNLVTFNNLLYFCREKWEWLSEGRM